MSDTSTLLLCLGEQALQFLRLRAEQYSCQLINGICAGWDIVGLQVTPPTPHRHHYMIELELVQGLVYLATQSCSCVCPPHQGGPREASVTLSLMNGLDPADPQLLHQLEQFIDYQLEQIIKHHTGMRLR